MEEILAWVAYAVCSIVLHWTSSVEHYRHGDLLV